MLRTGEHKARAGELGPKRPKIRTDRKVRHIGDGILD